MNTEKGQINRSTERLGWIVTLTTFFIGSGYVLHQKDRSYQKLLLEVLQDNHESFIGRLANCESHQNTERVVTFDPTITVSHKVLPPEDSSIATAFWVSGQLAVMKTEVDETLYAQVLSFHHSGRRPKSFLTVKEAIDFADNLSIKQGFEPCYQSQMTTSDDCKGWRIPYRNEWMMFANAGQGTSFSGSDVFSDVGWEHYDYQVGSKPPNKWGLHDMSGGRKELIFDKRSALYQLIGDGSVLQEMDTEDVDESFGLRLVREISAISSR